MPSPPQIIAIPLKEIRRRREWARERFTRAMRQGDEDRAVAALSEIQEIDMAEKAAAVVRA